MNDLDRYTKVAVNETRPMKRGIGPDSANLGEKLMEIADEAREYAYSPYSKYSVGAALLCMDGSIYTGCNVETAAFTGVCAERNAFFKAISEGKKDFVAIAISGGKKDLSPVGCTPCGVCRQVMSEFVNKDQFIVIFRDNTNTIQNVPFFEILPYSFGPEDLK